MIDFRYSIVLLIHYLVRLSALSLPISRQAIHTSNASSTLLPNSIHNADNVTAPTPPLGFSTRLSVNSGIQLKPLDVYVCAMEMMSLLSALSWDFVLPGQITVASQALALTIFPVETPPDGASKLKTQYAVLGMYEVGVAIAKDNQFYELDAAISVNELRVARLEYRRDFGALQGSPNISLQALSGSESWKAMTLQGDSGSIYDPDDKNFVLTFHWDGIRIKAQDVFTVFLDGFAIAAEHKGDQLDAYIPVARSASGDTVLSTWTVGKKENPEMTWGRVKRALLMMWDLLILGDEGKRARFEGFIFGWRYKGKDIGGGRLLRFDAEGASDGVTAVNK